jgi:hypothetical protein
LSEFNAKLKKENLNVLCLDDCADGQTAVEVKIK